MANTVTAANSVLLLGVSSLFPVPQQIQGFATDEAFAFPEIKPGEVLTGVDGNLSVGWVYVPVMQTITLQADSLSNLFFEQWYAAEENIQEKLIAFGTIHMPAVQRSYVLTKGVLTSYTPTAENKKLLQPRKYEITWQSSVAAPI